MYKHLATRIFSKKYNKKMSSETNRISKFWPLGKETIIINNTLYMCHVYAYMFK